MIPEVFGTEEKKFQRTKIAGVGGGRRYIYI